MSRFERFGWWLAGFCPNWLRASILNRAIAEAVTGKYSGTVVPELTAVELFKRVVES